MVELFAVKLGERLSDAEMRRLTRSLPEGEEDRIFRYRLWADRLRTLLAAKLLRTALSRHLHLSHEEILIHRDSSGRPHLDSSLQWRGDFNLSHSGEWIVLALTDQGRVGVDVEKLNPIDFSVAKKCFTEKECRNLFNRCGEDQLSFFYQLWTLKEAFVKMIGTGLSFDLQFFEFDLSDWPPKHIVHFKNRQLFDEERYRFTLYHPDENYHIALCSDQQVLPDFIQFLDRSSVLVG